MASSCSPSSNEETSDLPPCHEWGMDPAISSFRKVFVAQIHKIVIIPYSGHLLFYLRTRPILKVHVVGIVVCVDIRPKKITYHLDDGTGVIRCVQYLNENVAIVPTTFQISDSVTVKGVLEMYETNYEPYGFAVKVSIIAENADENYESFHIATTLKLCQEEI